MPAPNANRPVVRRCRRCGAILTKDGSQCMECELLERFPKKPTPKKRMLKKRGDNSVWKAWEFVEGFGFPIDQIMAVVLSVLLLLLLAICYGPVDGTFMAFIRLIGPMALIWFSEDISTITGFHRGGYIDRESHPSIIKLLGWLFLLYVIGASLYDLFWSTSDSISLLQ